MDHALPDARTRLLDAAEAIVAESGVPALTLEAAARRAGVSKGGLLYHFPGKEKLLRALMARLAVEMEANFDMVWGLTAPGPARTTRAVVRWTFDSPPETEARHMRVAAALLAAHHHDPALLDPLRQVHAGIRARLEADGLPPGRAHLVMAAADGLFMAQVFRIWRPTEEQARAMAATMLELAR
jgi:AcrR family transcriptional regulator